MARRTDNGLATITGLAFGTLEAFGPFWTIRTRHTG